MRQTREQYLDLLKDILNRVAALRGKTITWEGHQVSMDGSHSGEGLLTGDVRDIEIIGIDPLNPSQIWYRIPLEKAEQLANFANRKEEK